MSIHDQRGGFERMGGDMCPHGNFKGSPCAACQQESQKKQPALQTIEQLMSKSKFKRLNPESATTQIEIEGKKFQIESIEDRESPALAEVQKLLIDTFGEEEVDPEEILRSAVAGETAWGTTDETKYKVYLIRNEQGEAVTAFAGGHLDLHGADNRPTGETMFMVACAGTAQNARQGGLAREAYISAVMDAALEAQQNGKQLKFAAGECTFTSEKFWNSVGWKRAYAQSGDKKTYEELRYIQPALDFDEKTGEPAEDAGAVAEHFMVDSFGAETPDKNQIMQTIDAFYRWCNKWPRAAFESDEAFQKQNAYVAQIEEEFKNQLESSGQLIILE